MRKPHCVLDVLTFNLKDENRLEARKRKVTRLANMLASGKATFCTIASVRVRINHSSNDLVWLVTLEGVSMHSIDQISKLSHRK